MTWIPYVKTPLPSVPLSPAKWFNKARAYTTVELCVKLLGRCWMASRSWIPGGMCASILLEHLKGGFRANRLVTAVSPCAQFYELILVLIDVRVLEWAGPISRECPPRLPSAFWHSPFCRPVGLPVVQIICCFTVHFRFALLKSTSPCLSEMLTCSTK